MHKVKLFSATGNMAGVQKLQNEINQWLEEAKQVFNAIVIHRTDMIEACGIVIYSIYYTYLPHEPKTEEKGGPAADAGRAG